MLPLIFAVVAAVAGATGAYFWQENRYEAELSRLSAAHAAAMADATTAAHKETQRLQAAKDAAIKAAAARQRDLARAADNARAERDGLRDDLRANAGRLPSASCDAARNYATTASELFGFCADRLERVAGAAAGHASDSLTLQMSWPTTAPQSHQR